MWTIVKLYYLHSASPFLVKLGFQIQLTFLHHRNLPADNHDLVTFGSFFRRSSDVQTYYVWNKQNMSRKNDIYIYTYIRNRILGIRCLYNTKVIFVFFVFYCKTVGLFVLFHTTLINYVIAILCTYEVSRIWPFVFLAKSVIEFNFHFCTVEIYPWINAFFDCGWNIFEDL